MDLITALTAAGGASAGGAAADPNFNQTTLLLHGDGTNGAQNNTFLDSSTNNFTITRNGNTTQGTFSPFSVAEGEWSNYFDGSGDGLVFGNETAFSMGTGNFTWEAWIYLDQIPSVLYPIIDVNSGSNGRLMFYVNSSAQLALDAFSVGIATSTGTVTASTWQHVAIVRSGTGSNQCVFYINGVSAGTATISTDFTNNKAHVGRDGSGTYPMKGYISNARIVKGTAVYTAAFTPSTSPLTAIANTSLLTCQSNRFKDNSTNNFAITVNGNTSVQPFSPFAPSAAYSPSVNGGSGYFDGSGDYLSVADDVDFDMSSGDFCVEAWIYPLSGTGSNGGILGSSLASSPPVGWTLRYLSGTSKLNISDASNNYTSTATIPLNAWTHVAATRSGTDLRLFINGALDSTNAGISASVDFSSTAFYVGRGYDVDAGNAYFKGYILSARVVKGAAVYTSAFTPPTAPLTAISGTSFLCNFTNAGIFDNTGKNNLETVADAQIDTSVKKYGTGSMKFDGTGDYITVPASPNLDLTTGNFTIECWFYYSTTPPSGAAYDYLWAIGSNNINGLGLYIQGGTPKIWNNSSVLTTTGSISATTWYHIAVVRSSGTLVVYLDGVSIGSVSLTSNLSGGGSSGFNIARWINAPDLEDFTGYIDDLRITKGVARYTAAFTPPTAAFPDL